MNIRLYPLAGIICLAFSSCTEKGPAIDFSKIMATDTTYLTTPEATSLRNVLIEEYTGVQCTNCPAGVDILKSIDNQHMIIQGEDTVKRLVIIGYHFGALTTPMPESKYDFRSDKAGSLLSSYFSEDPNKPAIAIDRTKQGSNYFVEARNQWPNIINGRMTLTAPLNLVVTSSYDPMERSAIIKVKVSYTATVSRKQNLSVMLVENGIQDLQKYPDVIQEYTHNHVFREILTPVNGAAIIDSVAVKMPGRVYERVFIYDFPQDKDWKPERCSIVAFIHDSEGGSKEVAQAVEVKLWP